MPTIMKATLISRAGLAASPNASAYCTAKAAEIHLARCLALEGAEFGINFIPHTQKSTTWGGVRAGDRVNLEIDTLARYVARLRDWSR